MGAMGTAAGPRLLGQGRRREPRHVHQGRGPGNRTHTGPELLRRDADRQPGRLDPRLRIRLRAQRQQLVCRLFMVEEGQSGNRSQRPDSEIPLWSGHSRLRRPLHAGWQAAFGGAFRGDGGYDCGGRLGSHSRPEGKSVSGRVVERARAVRGTALLRWHALPDEPDALQRRLPHLLSDSRVRLTGITNSRELQSWQPLGGVILPFPSLALGEIRHSLRQLWRAPGFSMVSLGILAGGIASSAAMLAVVDQVLLRNIPYRDANQLVQVREAGKKGPTMFGAPFVDIQQWRQRSRTLQAIAFHTYDKPTSYLEGVHGPVQVNTPNVSSNLFATLGVRPALGRGFESAAGNDFSKANAGSALLSDSVWRDGFGADPNILGRVVKLNGNSYTVIGVMPRGFQFPLNAEKPQIWLPIVLGDSDLVRTKNAAREYTIIARLGNGVGIAQASAELKVIQSEVARLYTDAHARENVQSVVVESYRDSLLEGNVRRALLALLAAAGVLWLIAC